MEDDDFLQREPIEHQEYTDEDNVMYVSFIKAFAPVLLHLAEGRANNAYKSIIEEFQRLDDEVVPDRERTNTLRMWVDSVQSRIDDLSADDIARIMETARVSRLNDESFHKEDYELTGKKRPNRTCAITMERITPNEHYVDFLDNGNPYKVNAIIQYYKHLKHSNVDREEWKTPLRNKITGEQERKLDDLVQWYENNNKCTRSKRPKRSKSKSRGGKRSTGKRSTGKRSTGKRSTGKRSTGKRSTSKRSTGKRSTGKRIKSLRKRR